MIGIASIAEIAALIGDPARANILFALKDDGRISAGELSVIAGVSPSTASEHLGKLVQAGLVKMTPRGRRRYYDLADPVIAEVLEGVEGLASKLSRQRPKSLRWDQEMVHARSCLDHLAGRLGGQIAGAAIAKDLVRHSSTGTELTSKGAAWLASLGVEVEQLKAAPRKLIRLCPDWVEDMPHIGGSVGASLFRGLIINGWLRKLDSRTVAITPKGASCLRSELDLDFRATEELTPVSHR